MTAKNDMLAARHADPAAHAPDPADGPYPAPAADAPDGLPVSQEYVSPERILELLGESAALLPGRGADAAPELTEERLFGEVLIDAADELLETLQRERAENWAFRFEDPARASAADILEQLRSRTESLERISAACHGFLWHLKRAQDLGVVRTLPSGELTHAGWFVELVQARAGTPRRSAAGTVARHPAWALTAVLDRFRGADEVRQYLDRICAQSQGAVERLLTDQVLPLVQSLRAAQLSYSLHRA